MIRFQQWRLLTLAPYGIGVGLGIVFLLVSRDEIVDAAAILITLEPSALIGSVGLGVILLAVTVLLYASLQRHVAPNYRPLNLVRAGLLCNALNLVAKLGGTSGLGAWLGPGIAAGGSVTSIAGAYLVSAVALRIGFSIVVSLGIIQFIDGSARGTLVAVGAIVFYVGTAFMVGFWVLLGSDAARRWAVAERVRGRAWRGIGGSVVGGAREARRLGASRLGAITQVYGVAVPLLSGLLLWVCVSVTGSDVDLGAVVACYAAGAMLAIAIPIPGGLGMTELSLLILLKDVGANPKGVVAGIALFRLLTLWFPAALGLVFGRPTGLRRESLS